MAGSWVRPRQTNATSETYKRYFRQREKLRCKGKTTVCEDDTTNHDKHKARKLPDGFGNPCIVKQCNPRHVQDRFPENMGLADPHYVAEVTKTIRHSNRPDDDTPCCHGDDYDTDSEYEDDDDIYVNRGIRWVLKQTGDIRMYIPLLGALFVLWLFVMNYAIYGKGPASADR